MKDATVRLAEPQRIKLNLCSLWWKIRILVYIAYIFYIYTYKYRQTMRRRGYKERESVFQQLLKLFSFNSINFYSHFV